MRRIEITYCRPDDDQPRTVEIDIRADTSQTADLVDGVIRRWAEHGTIGNRQVQHIRSFDVPPTKRRKS